MSTSSVTDTCQPLHGYVHSASLLCAQTARHLSTIVGARSAALWCAQTARHLSTIAWVCKECISLVCSDCKASVNHCMGMQGVQLSVCSDCKASVNHCMGMQGVQLSGVPRLQGICQLGHRRCTGPAVISLGQSTSEDNEMTFFQCFLHLVSRRNNSLAEYFHCSLLLSRLF